MYRFADKYGANVDGYSPIYTPDRWTESGSTYKLGTKGLIAWCVGAICACAMYTIWCCVGGDPEPCTVAFLTSHDMQPAASHPPTCRRTPFASPSLPQGGPRAGAAGHWPQPDRVHQPAGRVNTQPLARPAVCACTLCVARASRQTAAARTGVRW